MTDRTWALPRAGLLNRTLPRPSQHGNQYYGLAIGFAVTAAAAAVGPLSGCALNPAIGLSLPLVAGDGGVEAIAVYCGATVFGGALAAGAYRVTNPAEYRHLVK